MVVLPPPPPHPASATTPTARRAKSGRRRRQKPCMGLRYWPGFKRGRDEDGSDAPTTCVLRLAAEHPRLSMVTTEYGSPTYAPDLAAAITQLLKHDQYGVYHLVNDGAVSRYDFARAILDAAGKGDYPLDPITEFPRAAKPPTYGVLRNTRAAALGVTLRHWREALRECMTTDSRPQTTTDAR